MQPNRSQQHLTAYYKTTLGIFFLVGGLLIALYSFWIVFQGNSSLFLPAILGLVIAAFGACCLKRPCFLLEPRQLTVYNLLGLATKRYTFDSWDVVKADSRRIYIDNNGITIKVSVMPWLVNTEDWIAMRKLL
ncbi:MAG: hypothetical protein AAGN15_22005 [Cyanobacteria bacterium J06581_3]